MKMRVSFFRNFYLGCTFVMILSFGSTLSEQTRKRNYNYAFEVWPVDSCPISEKDRKTAAERVGCNETNGYHCVPDRFHTTLIEFCYTRPRILVAKGNCLELAASGILNHVKCRNFTWGCPNNPYFSNEIQKYPDCLGIAFGCFTADIKCLHQMLKILQEEVRHSDVISTDFEQQKQSHSSPIDCELQKKLFLSFFVLFIIFFITLVVVVVYIVWKYIKERKDNSLPSKEENETLHASSPSNEENEKSLRKPGVGQSAQQEPQIAKQDDLNVQEELESEIYFEDIYLSLLMRRHCRNGAFKNFDYLFRKKILNKNDQNILRILISRDKYGRTLLHCAAEGGCKDIFNAILNASNQKVDDTTHCGHTVLHLACKNDKYHMCVSLLSNDYNVKLLLKKKSNQGWNAAHFAAASGNIEILELLENKNLEINSKTDNGLNVLDIASIYNHTEMCKYLMKRKRLLKTDLDKPDGRGWTTEHFVAMVGSKEIFKMLNFDKFKETSRGKTVLHICCEYGRDGLFEKMLANCKSILHNVDAEGWNALHYAAKGGNLRMFMKIEEVLKRSLCATTNDGKTVLHIACINNRVEICRYICSEKSYRRIINSQTKIKRWTAAHYVAVEIKKNGAEEKLISVLVEGGLDLQALTADRLTVLGVACEHKSTNLIIYLLENHFELVGVETTELLKAANETNDKYICSRIQNALKKYYTEKTIRKTLTSFNNYYSTLY